MADVEDMNNTDSVQKSRRGGFPAECLQEAASVRTLMWITLALGAVTALTTVISFWFLPAPCFTAVILLVMNVLVIPRSERVLRACRFDDACGAAHRAYRLNVWLIIWSCVAGFGMLTWWLVIGIPFIILALPFIVYISCVMLWLWLKVENALEEIQAHQ